MTTKILFSLALTLALSLSIGHSQQIGLCDDSQAQAVAAKALAKCFLGGPNDVFKVTCSCPAGGYTVTASTRPPNPCPPGALCIGLFVGTAKLDCNLHLISATCNLSPLPH